MIFCQFRVRGGGVIVVNKANISHIIIDDENLRSRLYVTGMQGFYTISDKPEMIYYQLAKTEE